ncbi:hypothetical protein CHARACLAT_014895 [Characodon lateralis]|uniref:Uncharacterized protein n=1 Tax=Characodon lateralis TaxID=208331 RepID=A0ABU7F323_9TELE|nr:hypothetical protein [Characodon lateralis]
MTDGGLDRANELNTFFNRFSSETSSASSSPAHSQPDIPPSIDPQDTQLSSNTSNVFSSMSAKGPSASTCLPSTISEDTDASFASTFHLCVSRSQVNMQLGKLNRKKAAGPDGVSPRVLKGCAE